MYKALYIGEVSIVSNTTVLKPHKEYKMLTDFEWNAIIDGIANQQCIICLGPELFTVDSEIVVNETLTDRLSRYLKSYQEDLSIKVQENGWFHLNSGGSDGPAYQAIKSFYTNMNSLKSKNLLKKIATIKFHLCLSLTPDYHLRDAFDNQGFPYSFDAYVRNQPEKTAEVPTKEVPLIYNLLGEVNNRNSLVLTYDDFYDYLESVIIGNSMSRLIKDNILNAQSFLFIGIPFDQWFIHLFMRILRQHKERKTKFAMGGHTSQGSIDICKEQYFIKFINSDIVSFIDELILRCGENDLLKNMIEHDVKVLPKISTIEQFRNWIEKNEFEKISEKLKALLKGAGDHGKPLLLEVIQLTGRFHNLKEQSRLGIIKYEEEQIELNKLRMGYMDLITTFDDNLVLSD